MTDVFSLITIEDALNSTQLADGTNLDTVTVSGFYDVTVVGVGRHYLYVHAFDANNVSQTLSSFTNQRTEIRRKVAGVWTKWTQIAFNFNALTNPNLDTLIETGNYMIFGPVTGVISGMGPHFTLHVIRDTGSDIYVMQTAYNTDNNGTFTRRLSMGGWSTWARVLESSTPITVTNTITAPLFNGDYFYSDTRSVATMPADVPARLSLDFKTGATIGLTANSFYAVHTFRGWNDDSGGNAHQIAYGNDGPWYRVGNASGWQSWNKYLTGETLPITLLTNGSNLNNAIKTGHYNGSQLVNKPSDSPDWIYIHVIEHTNAASSFTTQTCYSFDDNRTWTRRRVAGTWTVWIPLHNTFYLPSDNVLFTQATEISSSGGVMARIKFGQSGQYRLKGQVRVSNAGATAYVGLRHGIASANNLTTDGSNSFTTTSTTYVAFSIDFSSHVPANTMAGLYLDSMSSTCYIRNLQLCGSPQYDNYNITTIY